MTGQDSRSIEHLAQTNLQLYQQMRGNGYSPAELAQVARAYVVATKLFANRFRPCGRPFVAHLVGASAVLVWLKAPIHLIVAALLHAAYQEGDFPNSLPGLTNSKREKLRNAVGEDSESLIAAYTVGSRSLTGILASHARFSEMTPFERDVLLMQLANELDDYRDLAGNHAANSHERIGVIRQCGRQQVEMAEQLGYPLLAHALRATYAEAERARVPAFLVTDFANGHSIVPASCRLRYNILARRLTMKIRNRLRRHFFVEV